MKELEQLYYVVNLISFLFEKSQNFQFKVRLCKSLMYSLLHEFRSLQHEKCIVSACLNVLNHFFDCASETIVLKISKRLVSLRECIYSDDQQSYLIDASINL